MLEVRNCSFTYPGQESKALSNINLKIKPGTFLAIVGSNGSGKSTLCKLFNGIIPHFFVGDLIGEITVNGIDTRTSDVATLSEHVGYVYQDFENSIVRSTVFDEVSYAPMNYGFDDFLERANRALEILEIEHLRDERIWQLSGGQKHMVALAAIVAVDPEYIIVDEPVAQLDPYNAKRTYEMLKKLHEEHKKTIIVIEHHTEFIAEYCKDVLLMKDGNVKWIRPVKDALQDTETLVDSKIHAPQVTQLAATLDCPKPYPIDLDEAVSYFKDFKINTHSSKQRVILSPSKKPMPSIEIKDLSASYRDYKKEDKVVLTDINLSFYTNERIAIVGNNGAGKSTLLRLLSRLMKPRSGSIKLFGDNIAKLSPEEVANKVAFIYQNPEEMFIDDSIESDVAYFMKARQVDGYEARVDEILKTLSLDDLRHKDARLLSGGQQRRVSLAIGMGMTPNVILLDEPTGSLDISSRRELLNLLHILREHIKIAIVATHDMQLVADWASRVIVLSEGKLLFDGNPQDLFSNDAVLAKANLIPPQITELSRRLEMHPLSLSVKECAKRLHAYELVSGGLL